MQQVYWDMQFSYTDCIPCFYSLLISLPQVRLSHMSFFIFSFIISWHIILKELINAAFIYCSKFYWKDIVSSYQCRCILILRCIVVLIWLTFVFLWSNIFNANFNYFFDVNLYVYCICSTIIVYLMFLFLHVLFVNKNPNLNLRYYKLPTCCVKI